jgi:hypothetical protein
MDNRRINLRPATPQQQSWNRAPSRNKIGRYRGVFRESGRGWIARATHPITGEPIELGTFPFTREGEIDAAKAYDRFASDYYCGFGFLNFPDER